MRSNKAKDEQNAADKRLRRIIAKDEDGEPQEKEHPAADAEAENRAQRHIETEGRLAATRAKREAEAADLLAAAEAEWRAEADERLAATKVERRVEADDRLAAAEAEWKAEADRRFAFVAAAEAEWLAEADERFAEAKAARQREADERLSSLEAERQTETEGRLAATKAEREAEAAERLAAAEAEWRADADRRLAEAKAAWQRKADERFASARTKWERGAFERLSSLGAEWKAEADNRLAAARAEWRAEADKDLAAARTGWSRQAAQRTGAADRVQGSNTEVGAEPGIGEEFADLFAQQPGLEDQVPEAANVTHDPDRTDEKTAGVKRMFGRPWMWATAAAIGVGLVFASSLTPILDTVKSKLVPKEPPVAATEVLYVETDIANIREKASTNSRIISRVAYASKVTGVQRRGPWVKVITDGGKEPVGWIHASLLTPRKSQRR
ncbi:MAG: SH3 domain-containing protein [Proteobacteria bacterium]|nr:SH3 domain-containing protein [Pseudomonadota bacterium]